MRSMFTLATVAFAFAAQDGLHAQSGGATAESAVLQLLERIEDREAIRTLLIDYGRHFDARDFAAYAALFADDGVWIGSGSDQRYEGPEAIRAMVEQGFPPETFPGSYHIMTSISVELTGANTATAWSRWTFVLRDDEGTPTPFRAGHYEDELVRVEGEWKFRLRQVFAE